ncbi:MULTISPECIES: DEAD/DEAH box helicase [unclassified Variovorax]|uniref:DEAD/DEAH box helicase n=1 Tax=unclassified Variovorax TaxID=663243 RepID=UPI002578EFBE|nr:MULTISPECIES: DEAD/DEAH box helicase [unclassified Variovorax]MDM0089907.1 DEAD/DEAH box helicase [Variovorax sp. J22G40]MDM0148427.1 DEAD/DEAH box helicase [Variovorax sp. J2P1-31]
MPFTALGLLSPLALAASAQGYAEPTPVQSAAIPAVLAGRDLLASAQTGSGKTAAYALPLLQKLLDARNGSARDLPALVLVPTRELAAQVGDTLREFARALPRPLRIAVAFGGVSINPQLMALRGGADVMVATPGRLLDLVEHNALRLGALSTLVLDEADRLLDLGFAEELQRILGLLPARRQTLLFSATFPPAIEALAATVLRDPLRIDVPSEPATAPDIAQRAIEVDAPRRTQLLARLVRDERWARVLVFVATKHAAEIVADKLRKAGLEAEPFHGVLSQGKRSQVLADFKASRVQVVVATDLAARGIDVVQLPAVVNYDLPRSAVDHVHRIGRTGRAGERGVAVSFITENDEAHFRLIEKRQGAQVPREQVAGFEPAPRQALNAQAEAGTGGIKGKRPSKKDKLRAAAVAAAAKTGG